VEVRNTRYIVLTLASAAALFASTFVVAAQDVVEIRMRGRYYAEPATVRITVAVEPDAKNRVLVVQADGDRLFRSSQVSLEGDKEQRIHTVEFKNLPAGYYTVRAEVMSQDTVRGSAEELLVVGDPGEER
jgi:methionine-rich copper-binding protein CopC